MTFGLLLLLGLFEAVRNDISQHLLDLLDGEIFRELKVWLAVYLESNLSKYLLDIDFLDLQIVQHVRERFKGQEFSGADILLSLKQCQLVKITN
jgi:hypothetical protein